MKLQLTKRGDYAVRAVLFLARNHAAGEIIKAQLVADSMQMPKGFLPQVFGDLSRAGIVRAYQGKQGGYKLAKDPSEITLLEVIECVEGPTVADRCVLRGTQCRGDGEICAVHTVWGEAQAALMAVLGSATIARLAEQEILLDAVKSGAGGGT